MTRRNRPRWTGSRSMVIAVLALALLGCSPVSSGSRTTGESGISSIPASTSTILSGDDSTALEPGSEPIEAREDMMLDPSETADALADPTRVEQGVWSILANLGISVFAVDGAPVLVGSAAGPDD